MKRSANDEAGPSRPGFKKSKRLQQTWIQEVEKTPQLAKPVLDWRTSRGDAKPRRHPLYGLCTLGCIVLDRLCLVKDDAIPLAHSKVILVEEEVAVARNHDVALTGSRDARRILLRKKRVKRRGEAVQLATPVAADRRRCEDKRSTVHRAFQKQRNRL